MENYRKYLKYKKKYLELKERIQNKKSIQNGGTPDELANMLRGVQVLAIHGNCLDGAMSSYLIQKYGNYRNNIWYIPPGNSVKTNLVDTNQRNVGVIDLALPNPNGNEGKLNISEFKLVIDHHPGTDVYNQSDCGNCTFIYNSQNASSGIIWNIIKNGREDMGDGHPIQKIIDQGDRGKLSTKDKDEFYIYCALQYILDMYAQLSISEKINTENGFTKRFSKFPDVLGYIIENYENNDFQIKKNLIYFGITLFEQECDHINSYSNTNNINRFSNIPLRQKYVNEYQKPERNINFDTYNFDYNINYRTLFIRKNSILTALIAGKNLDPSKIDLAIIHDKVRLTIRKVYDEDNKENKKLLDADLIANYIDPSGGGHYAAASATYIYEDKSKTLVAEQKINELFRDTNKLSQKPIDIIKTSTQKREFILLKPFPSDIDTYKRSIVPILSAGQDIRSYFDAMIKHVVGPRVRAEYGTAASAAAASREVKSEIKEVPQQIYITTRNLETEPITDKDLVISDDYIVKNIRNVKFYDKLQPIENLRSVKTQLESTYNFQDEHEFAKVMTEVIDKIDNNNKIAPREAIGRILTKIREIKK